MASKTHHFHDYSFGSAHSRPRQALYRRQDPVELPRTSAWRAGGGALVAAAAVAALVLGSAYAAFREPTPPLAEQTLALPPMETWRPDAALTQGHVINVLQGPAMSVPEQAATSVRAKTEDDVPLPSSLSPSAESRPHESRSPDTPPSESPSFASPLPESRDVIIDDSKVSPTEPPRYPDPTTTPPDAIAPPVTGPGTTTPPDAIAPPVIGPGATTTTPSNPENPYQD